MLPSILVTMAWVNLPELTRLENALDLGDAVIKTQPRNVLKFMYFEDLGNQHTMTDIRA